MITAIKAENVNAYKALFEDASDILSGYKRVRTFDKNVSEYFYKNALADTVETLYVGLDPITSLSEFATALSNYKILYVKTAEGQVEGYDPMMGITTLEEYFSWLKTLGNINRKYTVLPLGEEFFEINTNTRAIIVPVAYKKNGVAVQGDDLAEVLYFKVDRYFDYMDLNNTDIFIQWETPKGKDGQVIKSVSPAYIRDIESEPGKLIFGWALSDRITAQAGALKFSVRFFQWENPELAQEEDAKKVLAYSLSTLATTVDIKPSINLNIETDSYEVDDCGDRLIERLENSEIVGGYAAAEPEFITNIAVKTEGYDLTAEGTYELLVQAFASDTGAISYTWKRQDLNEDNETVDGEIKVIESKNVFVKVEDLNNLNPAYAYYKKTGIDHYVRFNGTPTEEEIEAGLELYIKQSACVADNYGVYWAVAENRITNSVSDSESNRAVFPRPEEVAIGTQLADKVILDEDGTELSVVVNNTDGVLSYVWYYDANKELNFGDAEPAFEVLGDSIDSANYVAMNEGHYKVEVTNTRNKDSKSIMSAVSRVTAAAQEPEVVEQSLAERTFAYSAMTDENCFYVEINSENVYSDYYEVKWIKNSNSKEMMKETLEKGTYISKFNPKNYVNKDEDGDPIISEAEGAYYPIITNYVNGSQASTVAPGDVDDMYILNF